MYRPLALFIGLRYTRAKRRNQFISFISLISILGIILGVGTLIVVMSVMNGFEKELRARILSMASHATISKYQGIFSEWQAIIDKARQHPEVIDAAPYIEGEVMLNNGQRVSGTMVRGVAPEYERKVSDVAEKMVAGQLSELRPGEYGIVLGAELALLMNVQTGDSVTVIAPQATASPVGLLPRLRRFTVVGIFEVGMYEYDSRMAFVHIQDAGKLLRMDGDITGVRLKLHDMFRARQVAYDLTAEFDEHYWISDWTRRHANFFKAVQTERKVMFIILTLILIVAAINIISTLIMVVIDKQSDIAILRTLGATPGCIMRVFIVQGTLIGALGALLGMLCGVALAMNVEAVVAWIERLFHVSFLPADIYYISELPSDLRWSNVIIVTVLAFAISVLATLYPAWRAAQTDPAEALRYE